MLKRGDLAPGIGSGVALRNALAARIHHAKSVLGLARTFFCGGLIPLEGLFEIARFGITFVVQLTQFELGDTTAILSVCDHGLDPLN